MDDFGASSKQFEIWSRSRLANLTPLKYVWPFKAMGKYREMHPDELHQLFRLVKDYGSRISLGVTACWVNQYSDLVPFNDIFPEQAAVIHLAVNEGIAEVVNHGYTHCQVGKHLPRWFDGNREAHREFVPDMSMAQAASHLLMSQQSFREWLSPEPSILVPPGLQFPAKFQDTAKLAGLRVWTRKDEERCFSLHDRQFVLENGFRLLEMALAKERFVTCSEVLS